MDKLHLVIILR